MSTKIIKRTINRLRIKFFPTIQDRELLRWQLDAGDKEQRFAYPLNSESNVIDLGGYDGQWASDLFSRYLSNIYVFEAIPDFAGIISRRFSRNSKISTYPFAIGKESRVDRISLDGVGSSMFRGADKGIVVRVEDASKLFEICNITHCDLLKINIEGGEYEVLPRLIETGIISAIDNLQIQFHNLGPDSLGLMSAIQTELSKTHVLTWQYIWVWENWKRKER